MSTAMSAAQAAQQNNRGPGGKYSFGRHAEPEGLELSASTPKARHEDDVLKVPLTPYEIGTRVNEYGTLSGVIELSTDELSLPDEYRNETISRKLIGGPELEDVSIELRSVSKDGRAVVRATGGFDGGYDNSDSGLYDQYLRGVHATGQRLETEKTEAEPFVAEPSAIIINGTLIINGETRLYDYKQPKTYSEASKALLAGNRRGTGKARVIDLGFLNGKQPDSYDLPVEAPRDGSPMVINNHGFNSLDVRSGNVIVNVNKGYGGSVTVQPGATAEVYVGPDQKFRVDNAGGDVSVALDPAARCYVTTKNGGTTMVSGTAERSVVQGTTQFMTGNESMFRERLDFS